MKAIVFTEYGPPEVLKLKEVKKPAPKENEILIRNYATSIGFGDIVARKIGNLSAQDFYMPFPFWFIAKISFGFGKPRKAIIPGSEFAGEVEAVGKDVNLFKRGDQVFGYLGQTMGACAEYLVIPEDGVLASKPANMNFEEAAVVPYGSIMSLYFLREKGNVHSGSKVLVNGASGGMGSAAVQLAKYYGAEVTGVCGTPRLDFVKSLGADKVVDYTKEDFTQNDETYDLIFDVLGKSSFSRVKNSLSNNGRYLLASFKGGDLLQMLGTSISGSKKVICALAPGSTEDLISVKELIEAGKIKAVIDRSFPLEQVAEAHRYVEEGHKKGHIAITVGHNKIT
jgi:NADPH:quinone reductase-like Zn-dependent oxidoreductase